MFSLSTAWKILRDLGPGWVLKRLWLATEVRLGITKRRFPLADWQFDSANPARSSLEQIAARQFKSTFFFCGDDFPALSAGARVCEQADRALSGEWPFFSNHWLRLGFPPNWHCNVLDATCVADRHWSEIDIEAIHDVKFVWEPSRFSVVYLLARAYAGTRDERYPESFWKLIQDWGDKNPPNQGVNWVSGQEVALRVMAWCFGLRAFLNSPSSTPRRIANLLHMIEVHGNRIAGFIGYALSQKNNHGIGEAVGLFTIGTLFPEFDRAKEWRNIGRRLLELQVVKQVYEDGSYIQHSFNYQRVFIDYVVWALRLAELNNNPFSKENYEILGKAAQFMLRFCDLATGRMPNYGSNDGGLVLPLSSCDFLDYRPSLQAAYYLVHREFYFQKGEWNEHSDWLFGAPSIQFPNSENPRSTPELRNTGPESGYAKLTGRESYAMVRAARYVDRPSQADQLHMDLWWRGENIACDAGTFLYNGPSPWTNALAGTGVHNTITVGNRDQMTRAGRFLWVDWAQALWESYEIGTSFRGAEASQDGYERFGAKHRRSIAYLGSEDCWIVVDDIYGSFDGNVRLHWLFTNYPHEWRANGLFLKMRTSVGEFNCRVYSSGLANATLVTGGMMPDAQFAANSENEIRGWQSLHYGQKDPALSFAVQTHRQLPVRFVTLLAPSTVSPIKVDEHVVEIEVEARQYRLSLRPAGLDRIFLTRLDRHSPASVPQR